MHVVNRPSITLDEEDRQTIENLENLATIFDDELCKKVDCEHCPCYTKCSLLFKLRPSTKIYEIIDFFRDLSTEEG